MLNTTQSPAAFSLGVRNRAQSPSSPSPATIFSVKKIRFPKTVKLTKYEFTEAAIAGALKVARVLYEGHPETHGSIREEMWTRHPEACCAERAVSKLLNEHWNGVGQDIGKTPDVGFNTEVRWTHTDCLILYDSDPKDSLHFCVTGRLGRYRIQGYILGHEGIRPLYYTDTELRCPGYKIPFQNLIKTISIPIRTSMS